MAIVCVVGLYVGSVGLLVFLISRFQYVPPGSLPHPQELNRLRDSQNQGRATEAATGLVAVSPPPAEEGAGKPAEAVAPLAPPARPGTGHVDPTTDPDQDKSEDQLVLSKKYRKLNLYLLPLVIPLLLLSMGACAFLFGFLAYAFTRSGHPPYFLLFDDGFIWVGVAGIWIGIFCWVLIADRLTRLILGKQRYEEYNQLHMNVAGRDMRPVLYRLVIGITLVIIPFLILALDCYTRFEQERIVINPLLGFGEAIYPYNRIRAMVATTHRRNLFGVEFKNDLPKFTLVFDDGRTWTPEFGRGEEVSYEDGKKVAELIRTRTGLPLVKARHLEDIGKP